MYSKSETEAVPPPTAQAGGRVSQSCAVEQQTGRNEGGVEEELDKCQHRGAKSTWSC